jgi:hypothetical protein
MPSSPTSERDDVLMPQSHDFAIRYEAADATQGGIFGGRADASRQMIRGIAHYYVDGREVTKGEYERLLKEHYEGGP